MFGLPRRAGVFWVLVLASGAVWLALAGLGLARDFHLWMTAILFAVSGAIAETFEVALPSTRPGNRYTMTVGAAVFMAAIMVFPWQWAVVVVTVSAVIGRRGVWYKRAFNASHTTLSCGAAALVWAHRASVLAIADPALVPWILATVVAYLVCSSLLVSTMVAFASDLPVRVTFWRAHRHQWPSTFGMTFVGVLIAVLWSSSAWSVVLAAIPLTAIYYSLRNTSSLETTTMSALFNLADILDARDPYTHGHSLRVGEYAEKLALALGVSADEAHLIFLAGRLHDIGKCAIKNEVLLKPAALNEEEREHMCIHPEVGSSMLASFSMFSECARYVRGHHERWDGAGYPDRLAGEQIPYGARIIAVVDAYDAMTTTRPYRKALPLAEAYKRLSEGAGIQWDPRAVAAFLKLLDSTPVAPAEPVPLLARSDRLAA